MKNTIAWNEKEIRIKKKELLIISLACIINTIILSIIANVGNYSISVYGDELLYYSQAKGFLYNVEINGVWYQFKKILYPLIISPAFYITNIEKRITLILIINSILISTSGIFAYMVAKDIGLKGKYLWYTTAAVLLYPDMAFSQMIVSENLYYPLVILCIHYAIKLFKEQNKKSTIEFAVCSYILYMCKEAALCFPVAYVLTTLGLFIASRKNNPNTTKNIIHQILLYTTVYVLLFFLTDKLIDYYSDNWIKNLMFSTSTVGSNKVTYEGALPTGANLIINNLSFYVYSCLFLLMSFVLSSGIVIFTRPYIYLRQINNQLYKRLLVFGSVLVLVYIGIITFTVTLIENNGQTRPLQHLRYMSGIITIFIVLFFYVCQEIYQFDIKKESKIYLAIMFLYVLFYKGIDWGRFCCNPLLYIEFLAKNYINRDGQPLITLGSIVIYPEVMLTCILYSFIFLIFLFKRQKIKNTTIADMVLICYVILNIVNFDLATFSNYILRPQTGVIYEVTELNNYFINVNKDSNVLYITDDYAGSKSAVLNTYLTDDLNQYELESENYNEFEMAYVNNTLGETTLTEPVYNGTYLLNNVDYIIVDSDTEKLIDYDRWQFVYATNNNTYRLYKCL